MKFRELLEMFNESSHDVDLYHDDYDDESATMVDLSLKDFTEEGLKKFQPALDSDVVRVRAEGVNWVSVWVTNVDNEQVKKLSLFHAGYCSVNAYNRWFTMDSDTPGGSNNVDG